MKSAQVGATLLGLNWIGYVLHHAPGPMLMILPTIQVAERVSKQRLAHMIRSTPALRDMVGEPRSRDGGNTLLIKEFPGGQLIIGGANSAASLSSMPIRYLFCDEIDRYPGDVDGEGDPIRLAEQRQLTFARRKTLLVSTPTVKGLSRVEAEYLASDQRRLFVRCPHCGAWDWMRWPQLRWDEGRPETAALACMNCGVLIEERYKESLLAGAEWRPTAAGDGETRGYHLSALYASPGLGPTWAELARQWLEIKDQASMLKVFVNTILGETWEERGDTVDPTSIEARAERYPADVPEGVGILVASVDVQGDRLEAAVKGYGSGEESWLIAVSQFHGDPGRDQVWLDLDRWLTQDWTHESGQTMRVQCVAVDSGGHHTEQVYRFCRARLERRVFAIRGGNEIGKPVVGRPTDHNRYRAKLFTLCVDTAKETIYSRLRIGTPGPGYCHFPAGLDAGYFAQLTAEKAIRKWVKNRGSVREWIKTRERNEALDLEVYCLAALYILGPAVVRSLPERAAALSRRVEPAKVEDQPASMPAAPTLQRPGWIQGWRGGYSGQG